MSGAPCCRMPPLLSRCLNPGNLRNTQGRKVPFYQIYDDIWPDLLGVIKEHWMSSRDRYREGLRDYGGLHGDPSPALHGWDPHPANTELSAVSLCALGPQLQWGFSLCGAQGQKPQAALQVWLQRIHTAMFHNNLQWGREVPNLNLALPWLSLSCWMSSWGSQGVQSCSHCRARRWGWMQPSKLQPYSMAFLHAILTGFPASLHHLPHFRQIEFCY